MESTFSINKKPVNINVKEFAARFRSKYEIYSFLTVECRYYLPAYDQTSIWWLRAIALGDKKGKLTIIVLTYL